MDNIIERIKVSRTDNGAYYDYSMLRYINAKTKVDIGCPIHGIFKQYLFQHLKNQGCPKCYKESKRLSKDKFISSLLSRDDKGNYYDYTLVPEIIGNNKQKITIICPKHGEFSQLVLDHIAGHSCKKCSIDITKHNLKTKYGADNSFSITEIREKIEKTNLARYGVKNPSSNKIIHAKKIQTCLNNHGVEYYIQSDAGKQKIKTTNLMKYGVENVSQYHVFKEKMMQTKIKKGVFNTSNSSKEARQYIRNYINTKQYSSTQVAYSDPDHGLFEWGYNVNGKWLLFDLVVFEEGYRGDKSHIIEILEYQGPFHYTEYDVNMRGDAPAYPWKSKTVTIREAFDMDKEKEKFARTLTDNFVIVWSKKYRKNTHDL